MTKQEKKKLIVNSKKVKEYWDSIRSKDKTEMDEFSYVEYWKRFFTELEAIETE